MSARQEPVEATRTTPTSGGRDAQRRRTRTAIVAAATRLLADGRSPSVDEVAAEADVSRRTVYLYFPTLDQLLLDASVGVLTATTEAAFKTADEADQHGVAARVDALVRAICATAPVTLPLGRTIIRLTVDPPGASAPTKSNPPVRRGYRRRDWIEQAVDAFAEPLSDEQHERLVAALSVVIGWEAMVVLRDVNGLAADREEQVLRWMTRCLVDAMVAEATPTEDS